MKTPKFKIETKAERVKKTNEQFANATLAEKRVMIAKHGLALLDARVIKPTKQTYVGEASSEMYSVEKDTPIEDMFYDVVENTGACDACALGTLLISTADLFDNITVGDFNDEDGLLHPELALKDYFTTAELMVIEAAFERSTKGGTLFGSYKYDHMLTNEHPSESEIKRAIRYGKTIDGPKKRLRAILQNIIDNNGQFVIPEQ